MSERNKFFADIFKKELDRWKKDTGKKQVDFADLIGVTENMISKYRGGKAYPAADILDSICNVLGVEESIFYPQSYEDKFHYDEDFRSKEIDRILDLEEALVNSAGINWNFWNYFWEHDIADTLFPVTPGKKIELRISTPKRTTVSLNKEDLALVKQIQDEIEEYITLILMKKALKQRLGESSDAGVVQVLFDIAKDLICKNNDKEAPNGID